MSNLEDKDFFDLASSVASVLARPEFERWTMICWAIWNSRNRYVFDAAQDHPSKILDSASLILHDYRELRTHDVIHYSRPPSDESRIN